MIPVFLLLKSMCIVFACFSTEFKPELCSMFILIYIAWKDKWGYLETVIGNARGVTQKQSYLTCKIKKCREGRSIASNLRCAIKTSFICFVFFFLIAFCLKELSYSAAQELEKDTAYGVCT